MSLPSALGSPGLRNCASMPCRWVSRSYQLPEGGGASNMPCCSANCCEMRGGQTTRTDCAVLEYASRPERTTTRSIDSPGTGWAMRANTGDAMGS